MFARGILKLLVGAVTLAGLTNAVMAQTTAADRGSSRIWGSPGTTSRGAQPARGTSSPFSSTAGSVNNPFAAAAADAREGAVRPTAQSTGSLGATAANTSPNLPPVLADDLPQYRIAPDQLAPTTPAAGPTPLDRANRGSGGSVAGGGWWGSGGSGAGDDPRGGSTSAQGNAGQSEPLTSNRPTADDLADDGAPRRPRSDASESGVSMWVAMLTGLFFSLCANFYFIYQAWETHNRYEDLVEELAEERAPSAGGGSRRRFRDMASFHDNDGDGPSVRGRDDALSLS